MYSSILKLSENNVLCQIDENRKNSNFIELQKRKLHILE